MRASQLAYGGKYIPNNIGVLPIASNPKPEISTLSHPGYSITFISELS